MADPIVETTEASDETTEGSVMDALAAMDNEEVEVKQASAPEPQKAEVAEVKPEPVDPKLEELTKKEREVQDRLDRLNQYEQELKASNERLKELAKKSPKKFIEETGVSYEDLTAEVLGDKKAKEDPLYDIKRQMEELDKRLKSKEQEAATRHQQEQENALKQFFARTDDWIKSKTEEYELLNSANRYDLVRELMIEQSKQEIEVSQKERRAPRFMTAKEAADAVEKELEAQLEAFAKTKKYQSRTGGKQTETKKEPVKQLTNDLSRTSTAETMDSDLMSREDMVRHVLSSA